MTSRSVTMNRCLAIAATFLLSLVAHTQACSCMMAHPQEYYCTADAVAVVAVKKEGSVDDRVRSYHIQIKKAFKMTEKARQAISTQGLLWTTASDAECGIKLIENKRYLITARVVGQKLWVNLCNFVQEWVTLTRRQKKGFRRLYHAGCGCKVKQQPYSGYRRNIQNSELQCTWDTQWQGRDDCQGLHSVCVPDAFEPGTCSWMTSIMYKKCMQRRQMKREREHEGEP